MATKKTERDREISAIDRILPILRGLDQIHYHPRRSGGRKSVRSVLGYLEGRFPEKQY